MEHISIPGEQLHEYGASDVLVGITCVILGNEPLSNVYWRPRFQIAIPGPVLEELKLILYPFCRI